MKIRLPLFIVIALALAGSLALSFGHKQVSHKQILKIKPFDCAVFDTTNMVITPSDCSTPNGRIVGLQGIGTGVLVFTWYDPLGTKIFTGRDLINVPPGTYRVSLQDDSKCLAISRFYTVPETHPISFDNSNVVITVPPCNSTNGSIKNVIIVNAIRLEWLDNSDKIVGTGKDPLNVSAGTYRLKAYNVGGCAAISTYTINDGSFAPTLTSYTITPTDCGASGGFHASFDIKPNDPPYNWIIIDDNGKTYFSGRMAYTPANEAKIDIPLNPGAPYPAELQNPYAAGIPGLSTSYPPGYISPGLPVGNYTLITSTDNCVTQLVKFTIIEKSDLHIDTSEIHITKNVCGIKVGAITGLTIKGGLPPIPAKVSIDLAQGWFWFDDKGQRVGIDGFLHDVPSGWYTVTAINANHCATPTLRFFLPDSVAQAQVPAVNDVKMCLPGIAALDVKNKDPMAHYRLYDSTQTLIDTSTAGYFARKINVTTTFYIASINGICESPPVKVTATVVNPGVSIPNAFTPNNDGINDYWDVTGLGQYPGTEVSVFNRNGQQVYHTINYSNPFKGQYNGKDLPVGVYYYIVDTKKPDCRGGVSGSLTIIR